MAPLTFALAVGCDGSALGAISYPVWRGHLPEQAAADGSLHRGAAWSPDAHLDSVPAMIALAVAGLALLWLAPRVVTFLVMIDRILISSLLSGPPSGPPVDGRSPVCG